MSAGIPLETYDDPGALQNELKRFGLALKPDEARSIRDRIGRAPTLAELFVFDIEWSEHCSYKSSRHLLKEYLPTDGHYVIQGPEEDAGIVEFVTVDGHRYGIVFAHESHNHPSQVLPFEGAATGIGGIVRDVDCMGAMVIGVADSLRFGDIQGEHAERCRAIAEGVVDGITRYGNALGIPNVGGETVYHPNFDDNCLVNVVALGILREDEIIHSRVPEGCAGYDVILIGKPTDRSGFGGATFSSNTLDQEDEEENKGAVQIPDPFLKNVLLHRKANHEVRQRAKERGITIGMKDLGAGGIACCGSEICASAGYGVSITIENVHVSEDNLPPEVVLCAETQERYIWVVPPEFSEDVLKIYNEEWDLPSICFGAGARVIGTVLEEPVMKVTHHGETIVDVPIEFVVEGIRYRREVREPVRESASTSVAPPADWNATLLDLLAHPNLCNKEHIYRHYDTEVQGISFLRPGEADASVLVPLDGCPAGIALSVDGNPSYGDHSPFWGAATAIAESMRNVAAVGATPRAFTDCLNYGNPEVPEHMWALQEGVKGLAEAATELYDPRRAKEAVPFVSGNVSLYNQSAKGRSVSPSPIVACLGVLDDASCCVTQELKTPGNQLILVGTRYDEMGGSVYYTLRNAGMSGKAPIVRYDEERGIIYGTIDSIQKRLVHAAHDTSSGGVLIAATEMLLANHSRSGVGLRLDLSSVQSDVDDLAFLLGESSGMLLEVSPDNLDAITRVYQSYSVPVCVIGTVTESASLEVCGLQNARLISVANENLYQAWRGAVPLTLAG